jgi:hypothetical protein
LEVCNSTATILGIIFSRRNLLITIELRGLGGGATISDWIGRGEDYAEGSRFFGSGGIDQEALIEAVAFFLVEV